MESLPQTSVVPKSYWYEKLASLLVFKFILYIGGALALFALLFLVYLKYIYVGTLFSFLSEHLPRNSILSKVIPEEKIFPLTFEKQGEGNYVLKLKGEFVSLREDENNNSLVYLTMDIYLGERAEVKYHKSYSRTYWEETSLRNYSERFSRAKYFPDPTGVYPGWDVVGVGYSYLIPGDIIEVDFIIGGDTKKEIEKGISKVENKIKEERVYFLFAKAYK